ncbi:MAG: FAD-dependent oxidoreductase [Bacillota bacterium]
MAKRIVIVGGVAGGASAAARLRRLDEAAEIILFERGEYISFANCGLPYYIGGVISERENLLVQTVEEMAQKFNLDIRVRSEVIRIDRQEKEVEIATADGKTYRERYDYLLLSPGAAPFIPPVPGIDQSGIYTLRNMADVDRIKGHVDEIKPRRAVVIGAGFVGVEMAENLRHRGIDVTLVEASDQVMGPLDAEMASLVERALRENNIEVIKQDAVTRVEGAEPLSIHLKSGKKLAADMVILAIGVRPESKLAKEAGLELGERGGIKVDEYLRTSDPAIYAVGDAVEVKDSITGGYALIPLAGPANKQGRIAADNICGRQTKYLGTQGTSIIKVFEETAAATGSNEKTLKRAGIPYLKSYTVSSSHAGYYPGATTLTVKLLFSPAEGRILGAQIVGRDGVDKRIDVLATALKHGLTVYDLEELELAYAPPYSSAKDPVNVAGFVAANMLRGDAKVIHWDELSANEGSRYFILDVRTTVEYEGGHLAGAVNIPLSDLRARRPEIPRDRPILLYCKMGLRGYVAARVLEQRGYQVYNLSGGYDIYLAANQKMGEGLEKDGPLQQTQVQGEEVLQMSTKTVKVDACGLQCPGPIMKVNQEIQKIEQGEVLEVHSTDPAFTNDVRAWCQRTGNTFLGSEKTCCDTVAYIMKGAQPGQSVSCSTAGQSQGKTVVVFSGELDKAMAAFIIGNGAAAMGRPVTLFFTFWGLNILRKNEPVSVTKSFMDKMFGMMMPRGSQKLKLSNMNMAGMGPVMIRNVMKQKNVSSLEELIQMAKESGIKLVACQMSMDVMGIKPEELIDGVEIGGVAMYLGEAEQSNVNLFI